MLIVGGGPAGLSAGIYASRSGLDTVILEKGVLGGQVALTPVVENYPGMKQVGGKTLVDIMVTHALEYVNIFPGEEVVDIQPGETLTVQTSRRKFNTRSVLMTTGASHRLGYESAYWIGIRLWAVSKNTISMMIPNISMRATVKVSTSFCFKLSGLFIILCSLP